VTGRIGNVGAGAALAVTVALLLSCGGNRDVLDLRAGSLGIRLTPQGRIASFSDLSTGREYLPEGMSPPLLTLRTGARDLLPEEARFSTSDSVIGLLFPGALTARIGVKTRPTHLTLTLLGVSGGEGSSAARSAGDGGRVEASGHPDGRPYKATESADVDLAIWGPYPTTLGDTIGETVGVVRGGGFAMGIQALNPKTLGGYPWNENDAMPQLDIFESGDYSDLSEDGKRYVLYRVEAAKPDSFGSTLQAYTRNRTRPRVIPNWGMERYVAPAYDDGGIAGSAIALFGSPQQEALTTLGAIEVAEGLPHPTIDGVWGKEARSASAAYLILPFGEATLGRALQVTREAGLRYLYHPEPFATWGHFPLGDDFPQGRAGLRDAVDRAAARGVMLGVHTLSNFITTDDAYVTPVPDPRLARVGTAALAEDVSPDATRIVLDSPDFFNQLEKDNLHAAVLGEEIVRYRDVAETPPWTLLDVQRGAFGTRASAHRAGDSIGKLADHAYQVFLTDPELSAEVARNIAGLFNETGLRQISFDGLEGNRSTGMGNYGEVLFTSSWYEALSPEIRSHYIADASRTSHYFWHVYTRMNWGEPWYAGFRESQTEYRLKNQAYFRRNYIPGMLGWIRMGPETSVEDIEWMLARSAAFDAGYGFVTSFEALEENGRSDEILSLLGRWEAARMAGAFLPEQKRRMEDVGNEFHLDGDGDGGWALTQIHVTRLQVDGGERQPGEPPLRVASFENPGPPQPVGFILTAAEGAVSGIRLEVDHVKEWTMPGTLGAGEALVYEGGSRATVYSPSWQVLRRVPADAAAFRVGSGRHALGVDARVEGGRQARLKVEIRVKGPREAVASPPAW